MEKLTKKQLQVLNFVKESQLRRNTTPTLREIMEKLKLKAIGTVQDHLSALEQKGYIKRLKNKARSIELLGLHRMREVVELPVVGKIAAGRPLLAVENIEGYIALDRSWAKGNNIFLLKVEGDSMIGVGIYDGDYVIVKQQPVAENGEIVVTLIEDEATLKRFYKDNDTITLKPENPNMEPLIYKKDESSNISIIGKVTGVFRKYC